MNLTREKIEDLIFGETGGRRFTQDSPILPDVWIAYGDPERGLNKPLDLLLTPHRRSSPAELCLDLARRLREEQKTAYWQKRHAGQKQSYDLTYNDSYVVVRLYLDELIRAVLPLTNWWREYIVPGASKESKKSESSADYRWLCALVGYLELSGRNSNSTEPHPKAETLAEGLIADILDEKKPDKSASLWSISLNRNVQSNIWRSVNATKADAASRLFNLDCSHLAWAVIDSGIDARHPAFRKRIPGDSKGKAYPRPFLNKPPFNATRVVATYDFTRIRKFLSMNIEDAAQFESEPDASDVATPLKAAPKPAHASDFERILANLKPTEKSAIEDMRRGLRTGRSIDWQALEPLLRIPHKSSTGGASGYVPPAHEHGTHVAGILAADWRAKPEVGDDPLPPDDQSLVGVCPDLQLYDLRVMDDLGQGSEFAVLAALQFIRWLNSNKDEPVIHGANISLSSA